MTRIATLRRNISTYKAKLDEYGAQLQNGATFHELAPLAAVAQVFQHQLGRDEQELEKLLKTCVADDDDAGLWFFTITELHE